ncbi:ribosomal-processing cysteine protease Prp [Parvimonas micra]|jgi:hypothetical protein|uniref:ribosomal-processing cysteine protease Prp n=1 Tax=Parvimonas micra TaxID=33033 RepID=UPI001E41161D|nr:ribosomal-processing cysteine protease Prp [Parvimonas micra]MCE3020425.1 ribosomal-processing cysteine protease Prp [Parvimonas micra]
MTNIYIFKKKDLYYGFEMDGHADFSEENDILCASLSILSINTPNAIEKICALDSKNMDLEVGDGYLRMMIDIDNLEDYKIRDVQTIIKTFEVGIISLKKEYNKYIEIYYKEV